MLEIFDTTGVINIDLPREYDGRLEIYKSTGGMVRSLPLGSTAKTRQVLISENAGLYYLKFQSTNGDVVTKKVVVL